MIDHRSPKFHIFFDGLQRLLQYALHTTYPVVLIGDGGSAAMDSAVFCCCPRHAPVLVLDTGCFAKRFAEIAARAGLDVRKEPFPFGRAMDPIAVAAAVRMHRPGSALIVGNDTDSGTLHDLKAIVPAIRAVDSDVMIIVDAISPTPVYRFTPEAIGIDLLVCCSARAMGSAPGLGLVVLWPQAQRILGTNKRVPMSADLGLAVKVSARSESAFTPPETAMFQLVAPLKDLHEEGRDRFIVRRAETKYPPRLQTIRTSHPETGTVFPSSLRAYLKTPTIRLTARREGCLRLGSNSCSAVPKLSACEGDWPPSIPSRCGTNLTLHIRGRRSNRCSVNRALQPPGVQPLNRGTCHV